jgi:hypothetical protein
MNTPRVIALAATCLLAVPAPGAFAAPDVRVHTGTATTAGDNAGITWNARCDVATATDPTGAVAQEDVFTGELAGYAVAYRPADPASLVDVTLTCSIFVRDQPRGSVTERGLGAVVAAREVQYTSVSETDWLTICTKVAFSSFTVEQCEGVGTRSAPIDDLGLDPLVCGLLAPLEGLNVAELVKVQNGDLYVAGLKLWDCP